MILTQIPKVPPARQRFSFSTRSLFVATFLAACFCLVAPTLIPFLMKVAVAPFEMYEAAADKRFWTEGSRDFWRKLTEEDY